MDHADPRVRGRGLPPVWVISLERAQDRRESVTQAFSTLGIPFTMLDAVDGRMLSPDERRRHSRWRSLFAIGRDMTPGDVGCSLSHLRVYERMLAAGVSEVVVVEDDVQPTAALVDVLVARDALPDDWQVVTLHSLFASAGPEPLDRPALTGDHRVCTYARIPFGTQCYLINESGARRALDVAYPVRLPADELLYRRRPAGLRVYGIEPSPVVHADFGSELGTARAGDGRGMGGLAEKAVITAGKAWARVTKPSRMAR
ncbi:MAG: glycosyltransferase family 25 protein [Acidimicrobiia bacterium]